MNDDNTTEELSDLIFPEDGSKPHLENDLPKTKAKKKSAKEIFASSTSVDSDDPIVPIKIDPLPVYDDGILDLQLELPVDLGLTVPVEKEDIEGDKGERATYKASAVDNVPAQVREGMQLFGVGRRRQMKQKEENKTPRINKNTFKAFPNKELGSVNKTTFKG